MKTLLLWTLLSSPFCLGQEVIGNFDIIQKNYYEFDIDSFYAEPHPEVVLEDYILEFSEKCLEFIPREKERILKRFSSESISFYTEIHQGYNPQLGEHLKCRAVIRVNPDGPYEIIPEYSPIYKTKFFSKADDRCREWTSKKKSLHNLFAIRIYREMDSRQENFQAKKCQALALLIRKK